jgi:type II secretory pathway component PulF
MQIGSTPGSPMERDPRTGTSLTALFPHLLWISLLLLALFVGYFIVPKWEVSLRDSGKPLPSWAFVLIQGRHFIFHYWYAVLIGWAIWIWLGRRDSGRPTE